MGAAEGAGCRGEASNGIQLSRVTVFDDNEMYFSK
jgi:hypothetical protein